MKRNKNHAILDKAMNDFWGVILKVTKNGGEIECAACLDFMKDRISEVYQMTSMAAALKHTQLEMKKKRKVKK